MKFAKPLGGQQSTAGKWVLSRGAVPTLDFHHSSVTSVNDDGILVGIFSPSILTC